MNYREWLKKYFADKEDDNDWNHKTGSCGAHSLYIMEKLGINPPEFANYHIVYKRDINNLINELDKNNIINFLYNYRNMKDFYKLPDNNRYGNHEFIVYKRGDKYILTQGYLHAYLHKEDKYTKDELFTVLSDIITKLCDYKNNKKWRDIDMALYKKYFHTDLFLYPKLSVIVDDRVHGLVLRADIIKK